METNQLKEKIAHLRVHEYRTEFYKVVKRYKYKKKLINMSI